jgi:hypothetical protein
MAGIFHVTSCGGILSKYAALMRMMNVDHRAKSNLKNWQSDIECQATNLNMEFEQEFESINQFLQNTNSKITPSEYLELEQIIFDVFHKNGHNRFFVQFIKFMDKQSIIIMGSLKRLNTVVKIASNRMDILNHLKKDYLYVCYDNTIDLLSSKLKDIHIDTLAKRELNKIPAMNMDVVDIIMSYM